MADGGTRARPLGVTLVVAITWIVAIVDLALGAGLLVLSWNLDSSSAIDVAPSDVRVYGYMAITFGLITALVARALGRGSAAARRVVVVVNALRIALGVFAILTIGQAMAWQGMGEILLALVAIALLSTARARDFFTRH